MAANPVLALLIVLNFLSEFVHNAFYYENNIPSSAIFIMAFVTSL